MKVYLLRSVFEPVGKDGEKGDPWPHNAPNISSCLSMVDSCQSPYQNAHWSKWSNNGMRSISSRNSSKVIAILVNWSKTPLYCLRKFQHDWRWLSTVSNIPLWTVVKSHTDENVVCMIWRTLSVRMISPWLFEGEVPVQLYLLSCKWMLSQIFKII